MIRKRIVNNLILKFIFIFLFAIILSFSLGYSTLKQQLSISGSATTIGNTSSNDVSSSVESWFDGNLYYYKISITVFNSTSSPYISWNVSMDVPNDANLNAYSGITAYIYSSRIMCNNVSYNGNIKPNETVRFEFQFSTSISQYSPTNIIFNGNISNTPTPPNDTQEPDIKDIDILFTITNSWKSGGYNYYQYDVTISNKSNKVSTSSWKFDIELPKHSDINQSWNTNILQTSTTNFTLSNLDYNGIISPNSKVNFGLIIETKTKDFIPCPTNIIIH